MLDLELLQFIHHGGPFHGMLVEQGFQTGVLRLIGGMDKAFIGITADFQQGLQALQGFITGKGKGRLVHGKFRLEGHE